MSDYDDEEVGSNDGFTSEDECFFPLADDEVHNHKLVDLSNRDFLAEIRADEILYREHDYA